MKTAAVLFAHRRSPYKAFDLADVYDEDLAGLNSWAAPNVKKHRLTWRSGFLSWLRPARGPRDGR